MKRSVWDRLIAVFGTVWAVGSMVAFRQDPLEGLIWGLLPYVVLFAIANLLSFHNARRNALRRFWKQREIELIAKKLDEANEGAKPTGNSKP